MQKVTAGRDAQPQYFKQEDRTMDYVTLSNGVKMPMLGYGVACIR